MSHNCRKLAAQCRQRIVGDTFEDHSKVGTPGIDRSEDLPLSAGAQRAGDAIAPS